MRLAALCLAAALGLQAGAPGELGVPFTRNFAPKEYRAPAQNWAFAEDERGVLFAGNNGGVLEFDGATWRLIPTRNRSCVRSLALDASGRLFIGAKNEFGYLAPGPTGELAYVPLEDLVEPGARRFADVWAVLPSPEGVYFSTRDYLFRYDGRTVRSWKAGTSFTLAWRIAGRVYLYERGVGPVVLGPSGLAPLPGAERFAKEFVNFMVPWGGSILLGTAHQGLFLFDGARFEPFPTEADPFLRASLLTHGALLGDGNLAVAGLYGGCFILDRQGRLLLHLDRKAGLQEEMVNRLFTDRSSRLWLALNRGITRVEWPAAVTSFGEDAGLEGTVYALARHGGILFAGTSKGLFRLEREPAREGNPAFGPLWRFRRVEGLRGQVWGFQEAGGLLLAANARGVYDVGGARAVQVATTGEDRDALCLEASRAVPGRLYVGHTRGVTVLRRAGGRWREEGRLPGVACEARTLAEAADGSLWIGTQASGVLRVKPDGGVETFGLAQGLPSLAHDFVRLLPSGMLVSTHRGLYRFDPAAGRFEPDPRFDGVGPRYAEGVAEGPGGRIWMNLLDETTGARQTGFAVPGRAPRFEDGPGNRVSDTTFYAILPEPGGAVWMGGPDGLVRYDPALVRPLPWATPPLVRRVTAAGDRLLFGGTGAWNGAGKLPYASNTLRFEFAAPGGVPESATRYQVRLEGLDRDFSPWMPETYRDYTNLPEGRYRFLVRARDAGGRMTETGVLAFRILPPFYRAWWAYGAYLAAGALLAHFLVRWSLWRSRMARRILVRKVAERTEQLRRKTGQLELAKTAAEAATRAKSEFLANMSHEIRTPLNAVLGYSELLRDEVTEPRHREHLAAITSGGKALLGIIGDILDLSKIEAGRTELEYAPVNLAGAMDDVVRSFSLRCREKDLELRLDIDPVLPGTLVLPGIHLRQILFNLVGNAVKFTDRGSIRVSLRERARGAGRVDLAIEVRDTGIGIPDGQHERIFGAFHQAAGQDVSRYGGTGLGLTICRRLAGMMGGELSVESAEGEGSAFTLLLPGVAIASGEAPSPEEEAPFQAEFLPATLLLVDDLEANRELLKQFFQACPFEFLEARDGAEALERARSRRPDLVIMDLRMPGMGGLEATRRFKADEVLGGVPILVLTASTTAADEGPVLASGADRFLRKPISRARLAAELARFLPLRPPAPESQPPLTPGGRAALADLLATLEGEGLKAWEPLKDAFFIDRMLAFASRMNALAEGRQAPGLKAWAEQAIKQAEAFDMERLPGTFRAFPGVVEGIRRAVEFQGGLPPFVP